MKFLKQLVSGIALVALTAFGLTGCGGGGGGGGSTTQGPATPAGVVATGGNAQVTVSWHAVTGATSYNIYWGNTTGVTKANGTKIQIADPTATSYSHTNLATGTKYYYVVTAVSGSGESAASIEANATTTAQPAGPAELSATPLDNKVSLAWTAVSGATSYNVYRMISANVAVVSANKIATVTGGSSVTYDDLAATDGDTYYYKVTAILNDGSETAPSYEMSATPSLNPAPAAPVAVTATTFNNYVVGLQQPPYVYLSWTAVPGATGYYIYRSDFSGINLANAVKFADSTTTTFSDTTISGDKTYYYVVTAINGNGQSAASHEIVALPVLFTYSMVAGKTVHYTEDSSEGTDSLTLVCASDLSVTYTGTLGGTATSGSGTWSVDGGALGITLPSGTTVQFEYDMYSISGPTIGVVFSNGTNAQTHGVVTVN